MRQTDVPWSTILFALAASYLVYSGATHYDATLQNLTQLQVMRPVELCVSDCSAACVTDTCDCALQCAADGDIDTSWLASMPTIFKTDINLVDTGPLPLEGQLEEATQSTMTERLHAFGSYVRCQFNRVLGVLRIHNNPPSTCEWGN